MPRKKITYLPNLTYHVVSRCIELKDYLKSDKMKMIMENIIERTQEKYNFEFYGYVIMPNHIHFYIRTVEGGAPIYRIVQYLKSRFAEAFNRHHQRSGHFWNERYKCKITEHAKNPFHCCMNVYSYIGNNPVRAKLVKEPCDYTYSSFRVYVDTSLKGRIRNVKIDFHPYYLALGDTPEERAKNFAIIEKEYRAKIRT